MKYQPSISKGSNLLSIISLCLPVLFLATSPKSEAATAIEVSSPEKVELQSSYGQLPMSFEANSGQTDDRVKFLSRGNNYTLFLTPNDAVLALSKPRVDNNKRTDHKARTLDPVEIERAVLRMALVDSNKAAEISGQSKLPGKSNYFVGKDPTRWQRDIPTYARVQYEAVYPGIDLVYYGNQGKLEYDFIVAPGADPDVIKLSFSGADKVSLDDQGNLILQIADGQIVQHKPYIYQEIDGVKNTIEGDFSLNDENQISFEIATYDRGAPLVIDPVLVYSTYLGGSAGDEANHIAVDDFGNAYVTGRTGSVDFPAANPVQSVSNGSYDIFVSKLNAPGTAFIYSTYLGGSSGGDYAEGIAVDRDGNAVIGGSSESDDFPTVNPLQADNAGGMDTVVFKLNAQGSSLVYSTYLGGGSWDWAWAIATDDLGNAYLTGNTSSSDFPTMNPIQPIKAGSGEIFLSKLNSTGSTLVYSTFFGGSSWDEAYGIDVDSMGNAYITGETGSSDFPTMNPVQPIMGSSRDAFVTKVNSAGSALVYSTYLGGDGADQAWDIAVDSSGNAYMTGWTNSINFPIANALQSVPSIYGDNFVSKLDNTGTAFVYSTYLGEGAGYSDFSGIAVDASGNAYVTGVAFDGYPVTADAPQPVFGGGNSDAFVTKLNDTGSSLVYSTYLGGSGWERGYSIATTPTGIAYVTGWTHSTDFPMVNALQPLSGGGREGFITKLSTDTILEVPFDIEPQECPNLFNSNSNGKFSVAIPGRVDFNLALVDPTTLKLMGVAPVFDSLELDEVTPFSPFTGKQSEFDCTVAGADGLLDLRLKYDTQDVVAAIEADLGRPVQNGEILILPLNGQLYDGTPIIGEDVIVIEK